MDSFRLNHLRHRGESEEETKLAKHFHDLHAQGKHLQKNESVLAINLGQGLLWITGKIMKTSGVIT